MAKFLPSERPLIIGHKYKYITIEYDFSNNLLYYPYIIDEENENFKKAFYKFFEKYSEVEIMGLNSGASGEFCTLIFPYEYSDEQIEKICKELIKLASKDKYVYKTN